MKKRQNELKFSTLKIKKIVQENKEIGKIANMVPYVISKSLEYFLKDLLIESANLALRDDSNRLLGVHLKKGVLKNESLSFLEEIFIDVPLNEEKAAKKGKKKHKEIVEDADDS